jgi:hypothetical protein
MSFRYSGNPASSDEDEVRHRVGDTTTPGHFLEDEEITWELSQVSGDTAMAALRCVDRILARVSKMVTTEVGETKVQLTDLANHYRRLKRQWIASGLVVPDLVYAGGMSEAEKASDKLDEDATQPMIERRIHDITGEQDLQ